MQIVKYQFQQHGDERVQLVALEEFNDIPFKIKRVYYMYDTSDGVRRGRHAHKSLEQILICIHGSCKILLDDGMEKEIVLLDQPNEGLYPIFSACFKRSDCAQLTTSQRPLSLMFSFATRTDMGSIS